MQLLNTQQIELFKKPPQYEPFTKEMVNYFIYYNPDNRLAKYIKSLYPNINFKNFWEAIQNKRKAKCLKCSSYNNCNSAGIFLKSKIGV